MICSPEGPAHPHLVHGLRCRSQGQFTCSTSARFRVGYGPIQRVMDSPCLSAAGLGFLKHPAPTEDVAIPCGLGTDCSDLVGVFLFRIGEIQPGSGRRRLSPVPAPLRTVRATFTAHGSSKPIHSSTYGVSLSGAIQLLVRPLDTLLARRPCASISNSQSSVYHLQGRLTCHTSARFRVGYIPYPAGYVFPVPYRRLALASCGILHPLRN